MSLPTYRDLLKFLEELNDDQLNCSVSFYFPGTDEFYPAFNFVINGSKDDFSTDVLDSGVPILLVDE